MIKKIILLISFFGISLATVYGKLSEDVTEQKIKSILSQLTLEEKVALCHAQSKFSSAGVPRLGIPELWMSDGPHGVRAEINWDSWDYAGWTNDSVTAFPALTCLAATFNPDLAYQYGVSIGEEARYRRKDILLGPGVNIYRTPLNGRNFEYLGEDPFLASTMVVPYVKGVQQNGVAACIKHFALNNQEVWRNHINVNISERALHEIYLPAFKAAVMEGNAWAVMGSYNKFRGQYCSQHEILIKNILKDDYHFDGVVITDWGSVHDTREGALNGLDIEMGTRTNGMNTTKKLAYNDYYLAKPFLEMLKNDEIEEKVVNEKVTRILRLMFRTNMNPQRPLGRMNNKEHHETARKIASEGIVLLRNESQFFPINTDKKITIAVIGENAVRPMTIGGGSSELKAQYEISPLDGLKKRFSNASIMFTLGYASGPAVWGREIPPFFNSDSLIKAALDTARKADMVIFIGGLNKNYLQDCEGGDRIQYNLPFGQDTLIRELAKVNNNIGVLLISGNAVEMNWIDQVKGIMQVWYLGSDAGYAIADVLSGDVNPSGKLPFSFPLKLADNAAISFGKLSYPGDSTTVDYKEDILVGYRWHDTKKIKPLFPFGYGLSYSNFIIRDVKTDRKIYAKTDKIKLTCNVKNNANFSGAEVVQVYAGKSDSKIHRPSKELKGFKKVFVNRSATSHVEIEIDVNKLAYYDEVSSKWQIEPGEYILYTGNSSDSIAQQISILIR